MVAERRSGRGVPLDLRPWGVAAAVTLLMAWQTSVGPILFIFGPYHGVHLGDVATALVAADWAGLLTARRRGWLRDPRNPRSRWL